MKNKREPAPTQDHPKHAAGASTEPEGGWVNAAHRRPTMGEFGGESSGLRLAAFGVPNLQAEIESLKAQLEDAIFGQQAAETLAESMEVDLQVCSELQAELTAALESQRAAEARAESLEFDLEAHKAVIAKLHTARASAVKKVASVRARLAASQTACAALSSNNKNLQGEVEVLRAQVTGLGVNPQPRHLDIPSVIQAAQSTQTAAASCGSSQDVQHVMHQEALQDRLSNGAAMLDPTGTDADADIDRLRTGHVQDEQPQARMTLASTGTDNAVQVEAPVSSAAAILPPPASNLAVACDSTVPDCTETVDDPANLNSSAAASHPLDGRASAESGAVIPQCPVYSASTGWPSNIKVPGSSQLTTVQSQALITALRGEVDNQRTAMSYLQWENDKMHCQISQMQHTLESGHTLEPSTERLANGRLTHLPGALGLPRVSVPGAVLRGGGESPKGGSPSARSPIAGSPLAGSPTGWHPSGAEACRLLKSPRHRVVHLEPVPEDPEEGTEPVGSNGKLDVTLEGAACVDDTFPEIDGAQFHTEGAPKQHPPSIVEPLSSERWCSGAQPAAETAMVAENVVLSGSSEVAVDTVQVNEGLVAECVLNDVAAAAIA